MTVFRLATRDLLGGIAWASQVDITALLGWEALESSLKSGLWALRLPSLLLEGSQRESTPVSEGCHGSHERNDYVPAR
jgi:hypothetical protein